MALERYNKRKAAYARMRQFAQGAKSTFYVHYASSGLGTGGITESPTISAISVRNMESGFAESFTIFHSLERIRASANSAPSPSDVREAEKALLGEYCAFLEAHKTAQWIHWNMRDVEFGFAALAHRAALHGITLPVGDPAGKLDLAATLIDIFGPKYVRHPRLPSLIAVNDITDRGVLTGESESACFKTGDYSKIYHSVLRKVDIFSNIFNRTLDGTLKVSNSASDQYGGALSLAYAVLRDHWLVSLLGLIASVVGILTAIFGK